MTDDVVMSYLTTVDPSTGESRARSWSGAASAAKRDVAGFEAKARGFRANAGALQGKEGHVQAQVDDLLRQASACDLTAELRRGMAAGFTRLADQATAAVEKSA